MSTKSQKSVADALSEIFERSYTLKSISNEILSDIDDDDAPIYEILNKLDAPAISKLRKYFVKRRNSETDNISELDRKILHYMKTAAEEEGIPFGEPTKIPAHKVLWIDKDTLKNAMENILGNSKYSSNCSQLFSMLDPYGTGRIWWNDFLDKMVEIGAKKTRSKCDKWVPVDVKSITIRDVVHCKKDTIAKIVQIETKKSFCHVIISKCGKSGVYDGCMRMLSEYEIFYSRTRIQRRIKTMWVTDAKYMEDTKTLIIAASDRSLNFYDASTVCHLPLYILSGVPNIPTCISYQSSVCKEGESHLFFGDDHGGITTLTFKRPRFGLLYKKQQDKVNEYFWMELHSSPHDKYCFINTAKNVHRRSVRRIYYCLQNDLIISCSNDPDSSIVIRHRLGRRDPYIFKVLRGVLSFHLSTNLRILATGSTDGVVRLWDPVVTSQPFAVLSGHSKPIVDLTVVAHLDIVISFDKNGIVNIWDINEEQLLQSIRVDFPFMKILGKRIEFGTHALYPGPSRKSNSMNSKATTPKRLAPEGLSGRRESKVVMEEDGVLKLESEFDNVTTTINTARHTFTKDPEHILWNKIEFLVTCCSYIATLTYNQPSGKTRDEGIDIGLDGPPSPLPPPERMAGPRKPSIWDNEDTVRPSLSKFEDPEYTINQTYQMEEDNNGAILRETEGLNLLVTTKTVSITVSRAESTDVDDLLEKAGLQDILEKDFVKMMGLKHDLNTRMAEFELKQQQMRGPVSQCAPYIALDIHELADVQFSHPLPISDRMRKRSGLNLFSSTELLLNHGSCFSMTTPRTSYSCSSSRTGASGSISRSSSMDRRSRK